jgi:hypothetical protein
MMTSALGVGRQTTFPANAMTKKLPGDWRGEESVPRWGKAIAASVT